MDHCDHCFRPRIHSHSGSPTTRPKKEKDSFLQFQNKLKVGDFIVMASGIFGEIVAIEETKYKIAIDHQTIIEVMPGSIVGIDRAKQDALK
ncbi:preprotein translocase subunit YajC [Jeotgalibaca sp. MA1X17-3]|uniref:preprotein translocase subunit YajC n=1 Tax=Jeotgalibaca sp. MA1X17-3 TaxID=2908211 RepID=UPI001F44F1D0|nr:preprotein translocase subunit YajC [Jeotgalibaca sp. MA1X17-3]UJF15895.1 preprotein translocase subunit YajC [Jeotgalibaca sp. MA1X17-3]